MDAVFKALADANRRRLLDSLNAHNGQTLAELCAGQRMTRQSVSKHLAVLEAADLITTVRRGREKLHFLNVAPIHTISDRWIRQYDLDRARALADLKTALEQQTMTSENDAFVYTTYIRTTAERLWQALTDPAFTSRYWGVTFDTDWRPGSPMGWAENGRTITDPAQQVLESVPGRRLSYTWHTFTTEWAAGVGISDEVRDRLRQERRTTVTFEIEPMGDLVKLTVIHDGFDPGGTLRPMISEGWPAIVSGLKTLLETGQPLPEPSPTAG